MGRIQIIGIGPGEKDQMTIKAYKALLSADIIIGYTKYIELLPNELRNKEMLMTGMRQEIDRCRMCYEEAIKGKSVALICSGDAGVYGMASLIYELYEEYSETIKSHNLGSDGAGEFAVEVIPGVTAAVSGAAVLGAPINHDFCMISLSDLMTPWELIEKRLRLAAEADLVISLYNPSSHKRVDYLMRACDILLNVIEGDRACGYVRNIGRDETSVWTGSLKELRNEQVDMFTTCFIGNSQSYISDNKLITPRGYKLQCE